MFPVFLRIVILALSMYGYMAFFSRKIRPELAIGFVMASVGSITFLGGIVDLMSLTVKGIIAGGLVCLVIAHAKGAKIKTVITPGTVFFAAMCGMILYFVHGAFFVEQDNFTHWAHVLKIIIAQDRFPMGSDAYVFFPSYPLGSASFIYFFCEALGVGSEWIQMFLQNILSAGMLTSLFAFAKNNRQRFLAALCSLSMLACYIGFRDLLVDNLLAIVGFGSLAFCIFYKDDLENKVWYTVPYMVFLMSVKNSGLIFALFMMIYMLVYIQKKKAPLIKLAMCCTTPFIALVLWQQWHVEFRFGNGLVSKHAMSLQNFSLIFGDKTPDDIRTIIGLYCDEFFILSNPFVYFVLFILIAFAAQKYILGQSSRYFKDICITSVLSYIAYQIGLLGMYMFTMPTNEALVLACYYRYHLTILCFIGGVICIGMMHLDECFSCKGKAVLMAFMVLCVAALMLVISPDIQYFSRQNVPQTHQRAVYNSILEEYDLKEDAGYLIIIADDYFPPDPVMYCGYYLLGRNTDTKTLQQVKDDPSLFDSHPYVIMFSQTEEITEYVESIFGPGLPRVFHVPDYR